MTLAQMPKTNRTGRAQAKLSPPRGFSATYRASLDTSAGEVFVMNPSVALLAKGYAVGYLISKVGMCCKRFYVMGVNMITLLPTILAGVIISYIYRLSPFGEFWAIAGAFVFKGCAILPCVGLWPRPGFSRTRLAAIDLITQVCCELISTIRAYFQGGAVSFRPTFFGTVFCRFSVCLDLEGASANFASALNNFSSLLAPPSYPTVHRTSGLVS